MTRGAATSLRRSSTPTVFNDVRSHSDACTTLCIHFSMPCRFRAQFCTSTVSPVLAPTGSSMKLQLRPLALIGNGTAQTPRQPLLSKCLERHEARSLEPEVAISKKNPTAFSVFDNSRLTSAVEAFVTMGIGWRFEARLSSSSVREVAVDLSSLVSFNSSRIAMVPTKAESTSNPSRQPICSKRSEETRFFASMPLPYKAACVWMPPAALLRHLARRWLHEGPADSCRPQTQQSGP